MPNHLFLIRHGQSDGNVTVDASKRGDLSGYTDQFVTTPGHQWRLTDTGRQQAQAAGEWLKHNTSGTFDRYLVSPYVRTRETAGTLGLDGARWMLNRALRERDWGDIGSTPRATFENTLHYQLSAKMKQIDPLYWTPPGGESIAHVSENRVRNICDTLHRECDSKTVVCVTHGETMWAFRITLERLDDDRFVALDEDQGEKIFNCEILYYTRIDPKTNTQANKLSWLKRIRPVDENGTWTMQESKWVEFEISQPTNQQLLDSVSNVRSVLG